MIRITSVIKLLSSYLSIIAILICNVSASDLIAPSTLKKKALQIDRLVASNFRSNKIAVPEVTDDSTFLKRAFLVAVGRIPTPVETLQFLELDAENKRELLLGYLFQSKGYDSHMNNWLFDLLTITEFSAGNNRQINMALIHWVRDAVASNMPWDEFTRSLLSTTGNVWTDSGAAGYYAKDIDNPADNLSNTIRAFLGIRLECAQCHDDPFQEWERMDFYQIFAFVDDNTPQYLTAKKDWERNGDSGLIKPTDPRFNDKNNSIKDNYTNFSIGIARIAKMGINHQKGQGRIKLPEDYQYNDGDPGEFVAARTPFGEKYKLTKRKDDSTSLQKFAGWVTSDRTPQFSQTIALRLWGKIMGVSLTPTLGDYVSPNETNFPDLIKLLSTIIKDYDYDMKAFQKTLMLTRTFQFVSSEKDLINGEKNALAGRRVLRMTAEQIWDSLLSLYSNQPEKLGERVFSENYYYNGVEIMPYREIVEKVSTMSLQQYDKYVLDLFDEKSKQDSVKKFDGKFDYYKTASRGRYYTTALKGLVRASELQSPAPFGHLMSLFGQSKRRAAIDEATQEGTVTQALELLNGSVQKDIIHNSKSALNQAIADISSAEQLLRTLYVVVLNRTPSDDEMKVLLPMLESGGRNAYKDIVAGLVASQEFYFIF